MFSRVRLDSHLGCMRCHTGVHALAGTDPAGRRGATRRCVRAEELPRRARHNKRSRTRAAASSPATSTKSTAEQRKNAPTVSATLDQSPSIAIISRLRTTLTSEPMPHAMDPTVSQLAKCRLMRTTPASTVAAIPNTSASPGICPSHRLPHPSGFPSVGPSRPTHSATRAQSLYEARRPDSFPRGRSVRRSASTKRLSSSSGEPRGRPHASKKWLPANWRARNESCSPSSR